MSDEKKYHYLDNALLEKLKGVVEKFYNSQLAPEHLLMKLKEILPVHKTDQETWKTRVEGLVEATDLLTAKAVELGKAENGDEFNTEQAHKDARVRPLSYYHYVTGSREPAENVMKAEDYFNDPTTALVKLEDDVLALGRYYRSQKSD